MTAAAAQFVEAALAAARRGWPVIPLHSPTKAGTCTCRKKVCDSPAKHPRTAHGLKDGTTDEKIIRGWWSRWPRANLGICTGAVSGLVVVDVDPDHGGEKTLEELEREHGSLSKTATVFTGSLEPVPAPKAANVCSNLPKLRPPMKKSSWRRMRSELRIPITINTAK